MRTSLFLIAIVWLVGSLCHTVSYGEEYFLKGGGRVIGELLNPNQIPQTEYVVRSDEGVVFKFDRSQVESKEHQRPEAAAYERIWPRFADTPEDQWKLAEWCRENALLDERKIHLEHIVHLDPNHEDARRALGYVRRNGRWTTRDDQYRRQGYVQFEGDWRTPQEIQLIEEERAREKTQKEWLVQFKTYRDQLASGNGAAQARQAILSINDPAAIGALGKALAEESNPNMRELFLHALGNIGSNQAAMALALAYTKEPVEELRYTCLDQLKGQHVAVDFFVSKLGSKSNPEVNNSAYALGYLEDPSAIGPLVRSLITIHTYKFKTGDPNQTSTGFDSRGNVGFSAGGSETIRSIPHQNRAVLDALVKITGQNFGFNVDQWRAWHANQRRYEHINPRRD